MDLLPLQVLSEDNHNLKYLMAILTIPFIVLLLTFREQNEKSNRLQNLQEHLLRTLQVGGGDVAVAVAVACSS